MRNIKQSITEVKTFRYINTFPSIPRKGLVFRASVWYSNGLTQEQDLLSEEWVLLNQSSAIGKPNRGLTLEFRMCSILQPPLYLSQKKINIGPFWDVWKLPIYIRPNLPSITF